jgi:hypothetical protein
LRLDPIATIVDIPRPAVRADHPVAPLRVLNHQLLERGFELFARDAPGFELPAQEKELVFRLAELVLAHSCLLKFVTAWVLR